METQNFKVTLTGKNFSDVISQAKDLVNTYGNYSPSGSGGDPGVKSGGSARMATKVTPAKKAAPVEDEETYDLDTTSASDDDTDFMDVPDEDDVPVKKTAAKTKAPKLTDADVNTACKAYAKVHGKPATLAILKKKFKVQSILELKADQYAAAIEALEV